MAEYIIVNYLGIKRLLCVRKMLSSHTVRRHFWIFLDYPLRSTLLCQQSVLREQNKQFSVKHYIIIGFVLTLQRKN